MGQWFILYLNFQGGEVIGEKQIIEVKLFSILPKAWEALSMNFINNLSESVADENTNDAILMIIHTLSKIYY